MKLKTFSIVAPLFNEEELVEETTFRLLSLKEDLKEFELEILFVDDGSLDNSLNILKDLAKQFKEIKIISFSRNFGHQSAISAGLEVATGDYIAVIDADLQDPPEEIPKMYKKIKEGYDIVYGRRKKRLGESKFKKYSATLFYKFFNSLSYINIPIETGDFRILTRRVVDAFNQMPEKERFIRGMFAWLGYSVCAHDYVREGRKMGITKYPLFKMINFAISGIISFSNRPLRIVTRFGFTILFLTAIIGAVVAYLRIFMLVDIPYLTSILLVVAFFGGIQILILGIVGEYIAKIFEEVKNRPQYIISEKINFSDVEL